MKLNKKGFTLIELLAVIVILGLLMAIAIPSVTRYITQSRMKTLVNSIDSFIQATTTAANENEYGALSNADKLYYIPVSNDKDSSCVALEKGGTDPFGHWQNAYVVVHYDPVKYGYDYYFTFIDDAGYGMALTKSDAITPNGKQIVNPSPVLKKGDAATGGKVAINQQVKAVEKSGTGAIEICNSKGKNTDGSCKEALTTSAIVELTYSSGMCNAPASGNGGGGGGSSIPAGFIQFTITLFNYDLTNHTCQNSQFNYIVPEGMTFQQFISSSYNVDPYGSGNKWQSNGNTIQFKKTNSAIWVVNGAVLNQTIQSGRTYSTVTPSIATNLCVS